MKIIIDLPEDDYNYIKYEAEKNYRNLDYWERKISKGVVISEKATNGDAIRTMFSQATIIEDDSQIVVIDLDEDRICFWKDWWNAPYNAESEIRNE